MKFSALPAGNPARSDIVNQNPIEDALSNVVSQYICSNKTIVTGGIVAVAGLVGGPLALMRAGLALNAVSLVCGDDDPGFNFPGIPGGQCFGTYYKVRVELTEEDGSTRIIPTSSDGTPSYYFGFGPVIGIEGNRPGPWKILFENGNAPLTFLNQNNPSVINAELFSIEPNDPSEDDDCGPPPVSLTQPPGVYPVVSEPRNYYPEITNNDFTFQLPIRIGPINIKPELDRPFLCVSVMGVEVCLDPDFNFSDDSKSGSDEGVSTDVLNDAIQPIKDDLDELTEALLKQLTTTITLSDCSDEIQNTQTISTSAFEHLRDLLSTINFYNNSRMQTLCKEEDDDIDNVSPIPLITETTGIGYVKVIPLSEEVKSVLLLLNSVPSTMSSYKEAGAETERKHGHMHLCSEFGGTEWICEPEYIFTARTIYRIPRSDSDSRSIRLSLKPGINYTLLDSGER